MTRMARSGGAHPARLAILVAAGLVVAGSTPRQASAQDDPGQLLFNNSCRTCHTVKRGDNRLGPSLHAVVGRKAGSLPDYAYSDAMKGSGVVWDEANLDRFIENPDAVVPGNNMKPYTGIASPQDRATIIAYLKAQSGGEGAAGAAPAPAAN